MVATRRQRCQLQKRLRIVLGFLPSNGSFRQSTLEAISSYRSESGGNPVFKNWTARTSDDYGIALLEMWAYLGDILTFYQERIANEAFLRTAILRESVIQISALLDYKLAPGMAATTYLAFTLEKDKQVDIPVRLRVQSVPGQGEKPQKFETAEAVTTFSSLNEIGLRTTEPYNLDAGSTKAVVKGTNTGLKIGDYILAVGEEREKDPGDEHWDIRRLIDVQVDPQRQNTSIRWSEGLGYKLVPGSVAANPKLFVFRLQVWPFGYNAPDWNFLPPSLRDANDQDAPYKYNWNNKFLPEDEECRNQIFLDDVYGTIHSGSWIALATVKSSKKKFSRYTELYRVKEVAETVQIGYTLASKVTLLTVDDLETMREGRKVIEPENITCFPLKGTSILAQSELMEQADRPIRDPVFGNRLVLDGYYPDLQSGRTMILVGELAEKSAEYGTEVIQVDHVEHNDILTETVLILKKYLLYIYNVETVKIYGNVAKATHGETVFDEVLGSGDASIEFQSFQLGKSPVTFVPQPGAICGAANTLQLRVDGVLWHETSTRYGHNGNERIYTVTIDNDNKMTAQFGDGVNGARLLSGRNNVTATYRQGLGKVGNVKANSLATLLDRPVGLKSVTNLVGAQCGADPETLDAARFNAPNTVRTFGRIVSLRDFEDAAREYAGVSKARASWMWDGEEQVVHLTVAGDGGAEIEGEVKKNLLGYLDARRDRNRNLRVETYRKVPVSVDVIIQVHPDYRDEDVQKATKSALRSYFAFENLSLGQSIHLSDVYRVIQGADGLVAAKLNLFRFKNGSDTEKKGLPSNKLVHDHLPIFSTELAVIGTFASDVVVDVGMVRS